MKQKYFKNKYINNNKLKLETMQSSKLLWPGENQEMLGARVSLNTGRKRPKPEARCNGTTPGTVRRAARLEMSKLGGDLGTDLILRVSII